MVGSKKLTEYIELLFLLSLIGVGLYITKPLLSDLIWSAILAYMLMPLYKGLLKHLKIPHIAALFVVITAVLSISAFLVYVALQGAPEFTVMFREFNIALEKIGEKYEFLQALPINPTEIQLRLSNVLFSWISNLPIIFFRIFMIIIFTYYFIIEGPYLWELANKLLPIPEEHKEIIFSRLKDVTKGVIYGHFFAAIIQSIASYIGFILLGFKFPIILTALAFVLAILPVIGPWLLWILLGIYRFVMGDLYGAVLTFLYAFLVVSLIDDVFRPKIASYTSKAHPLIIFVGMFGGLLTMGSVGIFIGPILLNFVVDILKHTEYFEKD